MVSETYVYCLFPGKRMHTGHFRINIYCFLYTYTEVPHLFKDYVIMKIYVQLLQFEFNRFLTYYLIIFKLTKFFFQRINNKDC